MITPIGDKWFACPCTSTHFLYPHVFTKPVNDGAEWKISATDVIFLSTLRIAIESSGFTREHLTGAQ